MSKVMKAALALALAAAMAPGPAAAQKLTKRELFVARIEEKKTDALEVRVITLDGQTVNPAQAFRNTDCATAEGDARKNCLRVRFRGNFNGYVYFVNVATEGYTSVIYGGRLDADWEREYELPTENRVIQFKGKPGVEVLKVVMSQERIPLFEEALKSHGGRLGASAQGVAEELSAQAAKQAKRPGHRVSETVGIVQPPESKTARCRGLELAPGRCRELVLESGQAARGRGLELVKGNAAKNEGALVAVGDGNGRKLRPGEIAVFEIRLKHV